MSSGVVRYGLSGFTKCSVKDSIYRRPVYINQRPLRNSSFFSSLGLQENIPTVRLVYDVYKGSDRSIAEKEAPMIIIHGLFGSKSNNRTVAKIFARDTGRDVYVIDQRNHGRSPHTKLHDYPSMASDLERFIHDHHLPPCVLLGHSMGAKTAMAVSLRHPKLVAAMIAVDNAPVDTALSSEFPKYISALERIEHRHYHHIKDAYHDLAQTEPNIAVQQFLLMNVRRNQDGSIGFQIPLRILARSLGVLGDFPFDPNESRYTGPSLFIRGTKSPYVSDDKIPVIGQFFPKFILKDVDAGHWLISEKTDEFVHIVEDFLNGLKDV